MFNVLTKIRKNDLYRFHRTNNNEREHFSQFFLSLFSCRLFVMGFELFAIAVQA